MNDLFGSDISDSSSDERPEPSPAPAAAPTPTPAAQRIPVQTVSQSVSQSATRAVVQAKTRTAARSRHVLAPAPSQTGITTGGREIEKRVVVERKREREVVRKAKTILPRLSVVPGIRKQETTRKKTTNVSGSELAGLEGAHGLEPAVRVRKIQRTVLPGVGASGSGSVNGARKQKGKEQKAVEIKGIRKAEASKTRTRRHVIESDDSDVENNDAAASKTGAAAATAGTAMAGAGAAIAVQKADRRVVKFREDVQRSQNVVRNEVTGYAREPDVRVTVVVRDRVGLPHVEVAVRDAPTLLIFVGRNYHASSIILNAAVKGEYNELRTAIKSFCREREWRVSVGEVVRTWLTYVGANATPNVQ